MKLWSNRKSHHRRRKLIKRQQALWRRECLPRVWTLTVSSRRPAQLSTRQPLPWSWISDQRLIRISAAKRTRMLTYLSSLRLALIRFLHSRSAKKASSPRAHLRRARSPRKAPQNELTPGQTNRHSSHWAILKLTTKPTPLRALRRDRRLLKWRIPSQKGSVFDWNLHAEQSINDINHKIN